MSVVLIVLPIFALIAAGWLARRIGVLGPHATSELNRFVVYLAMPALLFDIVAKARWSEILQPAFVAAFGLGVAVIMAATLALRLRGGRHLADATVDGLNAAYANTAFIGFPLTAVVFGAGAMTLTLIATILTVCVLFAISLVLIEIGLQTERHPRRLAGKVGGALVRNPLIVAPVLGCIFPTFGLALPGPLEQFLKLLGSAASPTALVTLGLFLGEKREAAAPAIGSVALLLALKLFAQPLITFVLATTVFALPPRTTQVAVLIAALPTGTGPFMLAEFYKREAAITSRMILLSTVLSLVTVTALLAWWHG